MSVVILLNIILAVLVCRNDRHNATNKSFVFLNISIIAWLLASYLSVEPEATLWGGRLTIFFATIMSYAYYLFSSILPEKKINYRNYRFWFPLLLAIIISLLTLSPFTFTGMEFVDGRAQNVKVGPGMLPFALTTTFFTIGALYKVFAKLRKYSGVVRRQLSFVFTGMLLKLGLIIFTIMIPVIFFSYIPNKYFLQFAPIYSLIFTGLTASAILKYHLFNIRIIATETLVAVLVFVLFAEGLFSNTLLQLIYKMFFSGLVGFLGYLLIKAARKEFKQKQELANLAHSLEKANGILRNLDQQKTEFISIASHQLRTPLSVTKGYSELLVEGVYGRLTPKVLRVLSNMDKGNEKMIDLIDEFLDITRIEQGRLKFNFKPLDLIKLTKEVSRDFHCRVQDKGLKMEILLPEKAREVWADEDKIRHVLGNLLDNAIKYTEKGVIKVEVKENKDGLSVSVKDEGLGFDKKDEVNFFQKFYRGENIRGIGVTGTGLGLYVASKFIEKHNGKIWAKSKGLGKGSEFGFWLPYKED